MCLLLDLLSAPVLATLIDERLAPCQAKSLVTLTATTNPFDLLAAHHVMKELTQLPKRHCFGQAPTYHPHGDSARTPSQP